VWRPWAGDLAETEAAVEPVEIILTPPAAASAHLLQQVQIAMGNAPSVSAIHHCMRHRILSDEWPQVKQWKVETGRGAIFRDCPRAAGSAGWAQAGRANVWRPGPSDSVLAALGMVRA
jgi:hypothetical protein